MAFSLKDFAEPGDRYTSFATGERYIVPEPEYILCAGHTEDGLPCPFFVEVNSSYEDDPDLYAPWDHLTRGDAADEAFEDHEAVPGESHTLDWWKTYGPDRVRERFEPEDPTLTGRSRDSVSYGRG